MSDGGIHLKLTTEDTKVYMEFLFLKKEGFPTSGNDTKCRHFGQRFVANLSGIFPFLCALCG
ncbi:MAG: hypothetical protein C4560_06335 [Nitrospiraceae bacterium]|nr:MAG: hypothetical protein C4560_06335 [Nitrospiraceae bacterium]